MMTGIEIQIIKDEIVKHQKARVAAYDKMVMHETIERALIEKLAREDVPYDLMDGNQSVGGH